MDEELRQAVDAARLALATRISQLASQATPAMGEGLRAFAEAYAWLTNPDQPHHAPPPPR